MRNFERFSCHPKASNGYSYDVTAAVINYDNKELSHADSVRVKFNIDRRESFKCISDSEFTLELCKFSKYKSGYFILELGEVYC